MALRNISEVTRSVINLLRMGFVNSNLDIAVISEPPARLDIDGVGFYLYHVVENPHYKNLPAPSSNQPPVRFTPMGLSLYYQLSANSDQSDGNGGLREQRLMGIAMKTLHDHPEINDHTIFNGEDDDNNDPVMHENLRGRTNRFQISLLPVPQDQAVNFWTAGEAPLKFSAYYEVSVVLLEPEEIESRAGRVLSYHLDMFAGGAPRLLSSQNTFTFTLPGGNNRDIQLKPAQVPIGNQITFSGSGFSGDLDLLLHHPDWDGPAIAGDAWSVQVAGNRVAATIQAMAELLSTGDHETVVPGIYAAQLRVARQRTIPNEEPQAFFQYSNKCPFTISPGIRQENISTDQAASTLTITFSHDLAAQDLEVYLAGQRFSLQADGALERERYRLIRTPANANDGPFNRLEMRWQNEVAGTENVPIRIFINGAESPPLWINIP